MTRKKPGMKILLRAFGYMKPHKAKFFLGLALASCELVLSFATPEINKMLVGMVTGGGEGGTFRSIALIFAGLLVLTPLIALGKHWQGLCAQKASDNMKKALFARIQRMPLATLSSRRSNDYLTRVTGDADRAGRAFDSFSIVSLVRFVIITAVTMTLLTMTDWRIAVLCLVYNLVCFVLSLLLNPYVQKLEREARGEIAKSGNLLLETMRSLPVVRVFLIAPALLERYRESCDTVRSKRARFRAVNGAAYGIIDFFAFSAQAVGFIAAILLLMRGDMELGGAVYTASLMSLASSAMLSLSTFLLLIQPSIVAAGRVFEVLDENVESDRQSMVKPDLSSGEALRLTDISFSYPDGNTALRGISLTVPKGERLALVGGSGGGKTTLAYLIASLYDPGDGEILYFGAEGTKMSRADIRALIAYVPQEPVLFDGTLLDNIALGKPGASEAEIINAARNAGLHDFITTLPEGYGTIVGERGTQLSGGQRQRVAIARAMMKDAPILILDEATAALDSETEALIQQSIENLMKGRTSVTIAHRLATVKDSDRILVIENGQIAEQGTHNSLMASGGIYSALAQEKTRT